MKSLSKGERPHIVLIGPVNAGKSTLFNRILGQEMAVVSPEAGTTTDAVSKAMELKGVGPVVVVDTPGLDDQTTIGDLRMEQTRRALREADVILLIMSQWVVDVEWLKEYAAIPLIPVITHGEISDDRCAAIRDKFGVAPLVIGDDLDELRAKIAEALTAREASVPASLTGDLAHAGDLVLLVMPQDSSAPKGRLILPQVQTIRELLDKGCQVLSVQTDQMSAALSKLKANPDLIITDSQAFAEVERLCPEGVRLTSFSVLMSAYKGDLDGLIRGARTIETLNAHSKVLIAEACTHAPDSEDIGTVKIPRLLRKKFGESIRIDHVSGKDFPRDLSSYNLIIHCGACMFNRQHLLNRQSEAEAQEVPMTNYGMAIAQLLGILSRVSLP